eukprot:CAMPEP_0113880646 /NCGR_PEP_ID=MMETSP0780_2-20120614/7907_1 /TAXON_ID=652834 /ORGANISM="Palpitomonas bilix" /LENGTH=125 /DNA_ID=CAMNT_0000867357 /DNA_START=104 /DNA_END=481 /DNA_ORIENTATION=- /assembly_acc=CAM_ASM_000599
MSMLSGEEAAPLMKERAGSLKGSAGDANKVVKAIASNPVYTSDEALKESDRKAVEQALSTVKEAAIDGAVGTLSVDEVDVLMKYIYKLLAGCEIESKVLFKWHAALMKKGGTGSITRVLLDKRTV